MKLVLISDTHSRHHRVQVPPGDVLIHAGDSCRLGKFWEFRDFLKWFGAQPHKHKLLLAGNHDKCLMFDMDLCHAELKKYPEITYLEDTGIEIDGVKFWGSPWTPKFMNFHFMVQRGEQARRRWDLIPDNTDILITHGPPIGILDTVNPHPDNLRFMGGCNELMNAVYYRVRPKIHMFGHIHGSYGKTWLPETRDWFGFIEKAGILFVNGSTCTEDYKPTNPPIVLDFQKESDGK